MFSRISILDYPDKEIYLQSGQGAILIPNLWLEPGDSDEEEEEMHENKMNKTDVEYLIECFTRPYIWTLTENEINLVTQVEAKQLESMRLFDETKFDIFKVIYLAFFFYFRRFDCFMLLVVILESRIYNSK